MKEEKEKNYRIITDRRGYYYGQIRIKGCLIWKWKRFTFTEFETVEECEKFILRKIEMLKKEKDLKKQAELKKQAGKIVKYI